MPCWTRGGLIDSRDRNWLGFRIHNALEPHVNKIVSNAQNGVGGWEAWVQFELMYALTRLCDEVNAANSTGLHGVVGFDLMREELLRTTTQRLDLMIQVETNDPEPDYLPEDSGLWKQSVELYAVELKCKNTKESDSSFVGRIKNDIDKVRDTEWHRGLDSEHAASAWVVAISLFGIQLDDAMHRVAEEKGIQWEMIELSEPGGTPSVKIWTYEHRLKGTTGQMLLSYSSQRSLEIYVERGDWQPPEPVMHVDGCICDSCARAY